MSLNVLTVKLLYISKKSLHLRGGIQFIPLLTLFRMFLHAVAVLGLSYHFQNSKDTVFPQFKRQHFLKIFSDLSNKSKLGSNIFLIRRPCTTIQFSECFCLSNCLRSKIHIFRIVCAHFFDSINNFASSKRI